jgi:hypothetical protein
LSDQQAEIFRRIDAERIAVADANRRLVLSPAAQRLANRIDETLRSSYVTEPDEAHLEKSRYYCARFSGDTVASAELAAQWEKRKGSPPPPITDGTHE